VEADRLGQVVWLQVQYHLRVYAWTPTLQVEVPLLDILVVKLNGTEEVPAACDSVMGRLGTVEYAVGVVAD